MVLRCVVEPSSSIWLVLKELHHQLVEEEELAGVEDVGEEETTLRNKDLSCLSTESERKFPPIH